MIPGARRANSVEFFRVELLLLLKSIVIFSVKSGVTFPDIAINIADARRRNLSAQVNRSFGPTCEDLSRY